MKKFKKSVAAIFLACLLALNLADGVVIAEEWESESENVQDLIDFFDFTVNYQGIQIKIQKSWGIYGSYIQYTPIARAMGYEVMYDAEQNCVISDNGDTKIVIFLEQDENGFTKIWVTKNGEQKEYYNYKYAFEYEGATYIGDSAYGNWALHADWYDLWSEAHGVQSIMGNATTYLINMDILKADTRAKLTHLENIPSYSTLVSDYTSNASGTVSFNLNSSLFGIDIKGESGLTAAVVKNGDKMMLDFNMDNGGILNLYSLFCGPYTFGLDYYKDKIDLSQPVSAQVIFDGNDLYGKGDFLVENIALSNLGSEYTYPGEDYREIAAEKIDGKWVKAWQRKAAIEPLLEAVHSNQVDIDVLVESIVDSVLNDSRYDYEYSDSGIYDELTRKIDAIVGLVGSDAIKCVEANGEKVITYRLTTEALKKFEEAYIDTTQKSGNTIYDEMELNLESRTTVFADNTAKSTITGMFKINNIPNEYNIPFGSMEIKLDMNEETVPQAGEIIAPTEYVEFEQLYNESLPYRRQYQGL